MLEHIEQCADEGTDFEMEFRVVGPDGGPTWLYCRGKTFFDRYGQPSYIAGACVDITARKRAEAELRRLNQRLEHLSTSARATWPTQMRA